MVLTIIFYYVFKWIVIKIIEKIEKKVILHNNKSELRTLLITEEKDTDTDIVAYTNIFLFI